jgi:hypothetical protein
MTTHEAEPGSPSPDQDLLPGQDPGRPEPDPDQAEAAPSRRGKAWTAAVVSAWSAMAIIGLTVGRPELTAISHIVQRTTGMPAVPPVIPSTAPAPAPSSSASPPGLASSPTMHDGTAGRSPQAPGTGAPGRDG